MLSLHYNFIFLLLIITGINLINLSNQEKFKKNKGLEMTTKFSNAEVFLSSFTKQAKTPVPTQSHSVPTSFIGQDGQIHSYEAKGSLNLSNGINYAELAISCVMGFTSSLPASFCQKRNTSYINPICPTDYPNLSPDGLQCQQTCPTSYPY